MMIVLAHWCEESLCHLSMLLSGLVSWMSATLIVKLQQVMPEHEQAYGANGSHQLCDQESEASMAFARCFPRPHCSSQNTPAELSRPEAVAVQMACGWKELVHISSEEFEKGRPPCVGS